MAFVGRSRPLSRLLDTVEEAAAGRARVVLVSGEAGIGKTSLIAEATRRSGWRVGWGTCAGADRAPALWPWTQAVHGLLTGLGDAGPSPVESDRPQLARLLPELAPTGAGSLDPGHIDTGHIDTGHIDADDVPADAEAARMRLFDAVGRFLEQLAHYAPAVVVLDDLHWADETSMRLLRFVARAHRPVPLVVIGAYRHDELGERAAAELAELAVLGEPITLRGLSEPEVFELVAQTVDTAAAERWGARVHRRSGGHPFFARELAKTLVDPARSPETVPVAVGDLVLRRVAGLSAPCRALLAAAAVAGNELLPDVLAEVCELDPAEVPVLVGEAARAGVLVPAADGGRALLAHDLYRETLYQRLDPVERRRLHQDLADALERRHARGGAVVPADVARHCTQAAGLGGPERAVRWARAAARADRARLAFGEAAGHLHRARIAVEDTGRSGAGALVVDLLIEEADALGRSGDATAARALLADAWQRAGEIGDPERPGRVALATQRLGARFAMPRDDIVALLESAMAALAGSGSALEAQLAASLARELRHSVPAQRPRAAPLSEHALGLARTLDDPGTLAACLLARHDVLWTPGRAAERVALAREIAELAGRTGDTERHAEGVLLTANALLEQGSPAFRAALTEYCYLAEAFRQPRHDYLALTRRAALALIDARLPEAEQLIGEAARLGERISEPDTGNVRMSQLLGLVRALGQPDRLRATAAEAIRWWVGVPTHAHGVAAGLLALAGSPTDLEAAAGSLHAALSTDAWREDRSYLWPVFVGGMATAAVRLADRAVCARLLDDLVPVADVCGVNGALVCFMGSNAHWAGILAAALDRPGDARRWLDQALAAHQRTGARGWTAETHLELALLTGSDEHRDTAARLAAEHGLQGVAARLVQSTGQRGANGPAEAELRRVGQLWQLRYRDTTLHLPDLKGLADLATLLARPGRDIHVLDLVAAGSVEPDSGPLLDTTARHAYLRRITELDRELATAREQHDGDRVRRCRQEREAIGSELARGARPGGNQRALGTSTAERARKAVAARLRDAIQRIAAQQPELGAHLDQSIVTGTVCRYAPHTPLTWTVAARRAPAPGR